MALAPRPAAPEPPLDGELDRVTLERARRGDARAFRALVERYERRVFALLSRMLVGHDRASAEDEAQETFVRVHRALPDFDPAGPARLSTFILTIATRRAIDAQRSARTRSTALDGAREPTGPERPDRAVESRAIGRAIERAVAELSPDFRAAFLLRAYHELSHEEIAVALDCDVGTVKSRIARAKERLRAALEGVEP